MDTMMVKDYDKIKRHQKFQKRKIKEVLPHILEIQHKLRKGEMIDVIMSKHSVYREYTRNIPNRAIMEVIQKGRVIEYQGTENKRDEVEKCQWLGSLNDECINIIMMKKVYNYKEKRSHYLHVCLNIQGDSIVIKTVYDPYTQKHKWQKCFSERIFFKNIKKR